jgi:hypothetical protein
MFPSRQYLWNAIVLVAAIGYFARQKIHLIKTRKFIKAKLLNPWSMLTEILPLALASCCLILIDLHLRSRARLQIVDGSIPFSLRAMVAATTPLLWFRVLGHIKMFNKQLGKWLASLGFGSFWQLCVGGRPLAMLSAHAHTCIRYPR